MKWGDSRGGCCGIESLEMMFSGQDGPGAEHESAPGRWSFEELLRARKTRMHRSLCLSSWSCWAREGAVSSLFFIVRRQFTSIIISSSILANFYYYSLLSSCFCLTFVLSNLFENSFPLTQGIMSVNC